MAGTDVLVPPSFYLGGRGIEIEIQMIIRCLSGFRSRWHFALGSTLIAVEPPQTYGTFARAGVLMWCR